MSVLDFKDLDERVEERLISTPSYFSEKVLGVLLHWYQKKVIDDRHPNKALCWSRQIGKSTMVAIYVVWYIYTQGDIKNPKRILILSQDRDASRRFYNMVINFILSSPLLAESIEGEALQSITRFSNGVEMLNKAPGREGKSVRGDTVDLLIIDEADFIAEEVFVAAEQTTASSHGQIILISTPNRKGSTFYQYFTDGLQAWRKAEGIEQLEAEDYEPSESDEENGYDPKKPNEYYTGHPAGRNFGFKAYHYDYKVGLEVNVTLPNGRKRPQLSMTIVNRMRRKTAYWQFQQEYEAIWAEDTASYFASQLIIDATDENYNMLEYGLPNRVYYMGVDFAKHVDKTVAIVGEVQDDGRLKIVHIYSVQGRNWVEQKKEIMQIGHNFHVSRAFLDGTGVGDALFDELDGVDSPLYKKCQRVIFTMPTKNNVYQNLSNLLNANRIIIPHHKQLIDEMMYLQYHKMEGTQYVKIEAPKGMVHIGDDYPDAMALLGMGMAKNLLLGAFQGYLIRKNMSPYPNFWTESQGKNVPKGGAIGVPQWDVAGAKILRINKKQDDTFRKSRYVRRF